MSSRKPLDREVPSDDKRPRGRPELDESERLKQKSLRLLPRHWAKIEFAGLEALRAYLDRWQPKAAPKGPRDKR